MITGFSLGLFRLAVDTPAKLVQGFSYSEGSFFWILNNIFFQYYSLFIFIVSAVVMVVVSYATQAPAYDKISGLTYSTMTAEDRKQTRSSWSVIDVVSSLIVLGLIVGAYLFFRG